MFIEKHLMGNRGGSQVGNPYWATWMYATWENKNTRMLVNRYMNRPAEELYHTAEDRYELNNLAESDAHAKIKARLSTELDRWLKSQGDPGAAQDTEEALRAAKQGEHLYVPPHRE